MNKDCTFFSDLKCRECGRLYKKEAIHICEYDFGPLEASYDYDLIRQSISREIFAARPKSMWRYREFLPIDGMRLGGSRGRIYSACQDRSSGEGTRCLGAIREERYR